MENYGGPTIRCEKLRIVKLEASLGFCEFFTNISKRFRFFHNLRTSGNEYVLFTNPADDNTKTFEHLAAAVPAVPPNTGIQTKFTEAVLNDFTFCFHKLVTDRGLFKTGIDCQIKTVSAAETKSPKRP